MLQCLFVIVAISAFILIALPFWLLACCWLACVLVIGNLLPPMATTRGSPTISREGSSARVGGDALPIVGNLGAGDTHIPRGALLA